jgi:hypothetical protein
MAEEEYDAILLWKEALKLINRTANPDIEVTWPQSYLLTDATNVGEIHQSRSAAHQMNSAPVLRFMDPVTLPGSSSVTGCPNTIFRLHESIDGYDIYPAKSLNHYLAAVVFYHLAVSLHRMAASQESQFLLNESLKFYELGFVALSRCDWSLPALDPQILASNLQGSMLAAYYMSETAPSA